MINLTQLIYLDNNSTTAIDPRVLSSMLPYLTTEYGNANSKHHFGIKSFEAVKAARLNVAKLVGADPSEIYFTSGATEAINLAIKGVAESLIGKGRHIVTVATEHLAVLDTCKYLETQGYEISYLSVNSEGLIDLMELESLIRIDTILVIAMLVNNETGVILPIQEISNVAHKKDTFLFSDATQAVGKVPINVDDLGIDLMCLSGHKFYGPKGVGALFVRQRNNRVKIKPIIHGGGHEKGLRSGTLNVYGIVGLGSACYFALNEMNENIEKIGALKYHLEQSILKIDGTSINGSVSKRLYTTSNILIKDVDSDALILGLSNPEGGGPEIAVSNGSACTSQSFYPSHVLSAMGLNETEAFSSIRFSIGKYNSFDEIEFTISQIAKIIAQLRAMNN